jgi:hypothetical protein
VPKPLDFIPETVFPEGHPKAGKPRCHAWSRNAGRQCNKSPMRGKRVCRSHGGAGGRKPIHGKFSVPQKLQKAYESMLSNFKSYDLRDEIGLLVARNQQLFDNFDRKDVSIAHEGILKAAKMIERGVEQEKPYLCRKGLDKLYSAIDPVQLEIITWKEVMQNMKLIGNLTAKQAELWRSDDQNLPVQDVIAMLNNILGIVFHNVPDQEVVDLINKEVRHYLPQSMTTAERFKRTLSSRSRITPPK